MSCLRCAVFLFLLLLAGCLEVESMEVRVVADAKNDRLDVLIVSRGIWSSERREGEVARDLATLRRCREHGAIPWPGFSALDFAEPPSPHDKNPFGVAEWLEASQFVDLEAGAFFLDEQGRLSFYQFVRLHRLRELVAFCNRHAHALLAAEDKRASEATLELRRKAAAEQLPVVAIDGAGFVVRVPMSDEDHRLQHDKLWEQWQRRSASAGKGNRKQAPAAGDSELQVMSLNDIAVVRRQGLTEYFIGTQGSEVCDYRLPGAQPYQDNLKEALGEEGTQLPVLAREAVFAKFAEFRTRQAQLPAAYVENKQRAAKAAGR